MLRLPLCDHPKHVDVEVGSALSNSPNYLENDFETTRGPI